MNVSYSQPLSHAWLRMKRLLFKPFDIGAWFVLGFTAFLASIADSFSGGGGSNLQSKFNPSSDFDSLGDFFDNAGDSMGNFLGVSLGLGIISLILLGVVFFGLLFLWLGSRGRFMFLDNLVHRRTEVTRPWSEFSSEANSLFLWQLVYALVSLMILGFLTMISVVVFVPLFAGDARWIVTVPLAIFAGTSAFILIVVMLFVDFFLIAFVVPIMHKERISAMAAWSRFLTLFREHPGSFVLCGLFYLILVIVGGLTLFFGGLVTCCVGLLLLALPYIGSVVSLPMTVTLRYFTLDFLGQFGEDFRLLDPVENLGQFNENRAVIRPEDISHDGGFDEPGPQDTGD